MRVDQSVHLMSEGGCVVLSGPVLTGQVHVRCVEESDKVWSTLIGRGMSRLVSHWSRASPVMLAPAILCHKEPARASKAPYQGLWNAKYPHIFACPSLVLYVIRIVGFHARKGPIIGANENSGYISSTSLSRTGPRSCWRQQSCAIKNQEPFWLCFSPVLICAFNLTFPCMESNYPLCH